ncbi:hypothetical protein [Oleiagrimonas soli]|uniref:Uncharacterized protein n=1 Tax=Oleiagrimonas soli TaxID=1543381 RepID=A0A841KNE3_9GAMM|nr:hypothetical protein [Oleiagrimonas soli]MBB6183494.1 hypothetical protein [Oleiagrimonas soli]
MACIAKAARRFSATVVGARVSVMGIHTCPHNVRRDALGASGIHFRSKEHIRHDHETSPGKFGDLFAVHVCRDCGRVFTWTHGTGSQCIVAGSAC